MVNFFSSEITSTNIFFGWLEDISNISPAKVGQVLSMAIIKDIARKLPLILVHIWSQINKKV
jgi:hypothetical protein